MTISQDEQKQLAGKRAATFVEDGMVVGIGSGSTIAYVIEALGQRVKEENLQIIGVPTSEKTRRAAAKLNIPMYNVDDVDHIDLTIDGADQIDGEFAAIKGGGAALLWEKIVAVNSNQNIWVVDESKFVPKLTQYLPVEVIPYGSEQLFKKLKHLGLNPKWRLDQNGNPVRTDSANFLIDLFIGEIDQPTQIGHLLTNLVGVVEHGLFLHIADRVVVGRSSGEVTLIDSKYTN